MNESMHAKEPRLDDARVPASRPAARREPPSASERTLADRLEQVEREARDLRRVVEEMSKRNTSLECRLMLLERRVERSADARGDRPAY